PENDGKIAIPLLDRAGDLDRLADHGPRNERDAETQGVAHFGKDALLEVRRDRRVDQNDLESRTFQWRCYRQNSQWGRRFRTGKGRKEKDDFPRGTQPEHPAGSPNLGYRRIVSRVVAELSRFCNLFPAILGFHAV